MAIEEIMYKTMDAFIRNYQMSNNDVARMKTDAYAEEFVHNLKLADELKYIRYYHENKNGRISCSR